MKLIYYGAIDILDSELPTFRKVCSELKIAGLPVFDAELPVLDAEVVPMEENLLTSSGLPASTCSDAGTASDSGSPDALNSATGFRFELGENSGLSIATALPIDAVTTTGGELAGSTGLPMDENEATGLPAEQSSSTGLPEKMDEDESEPKRPRLSEENRNISVKVNFSLL